MAQDLDFADEEIKSLNDWLGRTLATMSGSLADDGHSLQIDIQSTSLKEEAEIRPLLPADALSWTITSEGSEGLFLVLVGREAGLSLARGSDDEGLAERLNEESGFSDEEKQQATPVQEKLAQALAEAAGQDASTPFIAGAVDVLSASSWDSGTDPLTESSFLITPLTVRCGDGPESSGLVILDPGLIRSSFAAALEAVAVSEGEGELLIYPASSSMKDNIVAQMGSAPAECETVAELIRGFVDQKIDGAIIGVGRNELKILSLLRGMKELPGCENKSIVVVLEEPSTENVVRCGRLGLFSVLPPEFNKDELQAKLSRPE